MNVSRTFIRGLRFLLAPAVVWVLYFLKVNMWCRLYPVVMVALALGVFAVSLRRTPLVEIFARKMGERLDARGVVYCRQVTRVWVGFLSAHLLVTTATIWASPQVWAFYNGCLAYVLMGALFLGEWLYRKQVRRG